MKDASPAPAAEPTPGTPEAAKSAPAVEIDPAYMQAAQAANNREEGGGRKYRVQSQERRKHPPGKAGEEPVIFRPDDERKERDDGAPDPNQIVTIYNRNPRFGIITHTEYEDTVHPEGRVSRRKLRTWTAPGSQFTRVPRWLAEMWIRMFSGQIVDAVNVGAPRNHNPSEMNELKTKMTDLEQKNAELEKVISQLKAKGFVT